MSGIVIYGKPDCADYLRTRAVLADAGVEHVFHDIAADPAAAAEAAELGGSDRSPVVVFSDGAVAVEPSDDEVRAKLR